MTHAFAITTTSAAGQLSGARRGHFEFTVTNTSGRALTARPKVATDPPGHEAWFTIAGAAEQQLDDGATLQVGLDVAVPATEPAGSLAFRLDVVGVENPDELTTKGPQVVVQVPAAPARKPFPWWIVAAAAAVLLVVAAGGGYAWYRTHPSPSPTPVAKVTPTPTPTAVPTNPADPFSKFSGNWVSTGPLTLRSVGRIQLTKAQGSAVTVDLWTVCLNSALQPYVCRDPAIEAVGTYDQTTDSVRVHWVISGQGTDVEVTHLGSGHLLVHVTKADGPFPFSVGFYEEGPSGAKPTLCMVIVQKNPQILVSATP